MLSTRATTFTVRVPTLVEPGKTYELYGNHVAPKDQAEADLINAQAHEYAKKALLPALDFVISNIEQTCIDAAYEFAESQQAFSERGDLLRPVSHILTAGPYILETCISPKAQKPKYADVFRGTLGFLDQIVVHNEERRTEGVRRFGNELYIAPFYVLKEMERLRHKRKDVPKIDEHVFLQGIAHELTELVIPIAEARFSVVNPETAEYYAKALVLRAAVDVFVKEYADQMKTRQSEETVVQHLPEGNYLNIFTAKSSTSYESIYARLAEPPTPPKGKQTDDVYDVDTGDLHLIDHFAFAEPYHHEMTKTRNKVKTPFSLTVTTDVTDERKLLTITRTEGNLADVQLYRIEQTENHVFVAIADLKKTLQDLYKQQTVSTIAFSQMALHQVPPYLR